MSDLVTADLRTHTDQGLDDAVEWLQLACIEKQKLIESLQGELDKINTKLEKVLDRWAFRLRGMFAWRRRARKAEAKIEHVRELLDTPDSMVSFITISKIRKALKENSDE